MNLKLATLAFALGTGLAGAQGTFVYDQQSLGPNDGGLGLNWTPFGQSFTPTLDSIGFVDLQLFNDTSDSIVAVNLRSGSITGPILGTSQSSIVPVSSPTIYDFLFSNPITLTPGTLYFFEPVILSGGFPTSFAVSTHYAGGDAIYNGTPSGAHQDLWFREGIITTVPEPSFAALLLASGGLLYWHRRKQSKTRMGNLCDANG